MSANFALRVELKAKPDKKSEIEAFLKNAVAVVREEPGTLSWYAAEDEGEPGVYIVFDTFNDETARDAHLNGRVAQELGAHWEELCSEAPKIHRLRIIAEK